MIYKKKKNKESYHARRKNVFDTLCEFGVSIGLSKRIIYRYPLNLLEKLIQETKDRQSVTPADYFLNGLKRSRMQYGDYRKRDRKKKKREF
ncbi:hypothetical protein AYK25_00630 [Thermoplasmatales archaeon SM1-50]|nr:MAG: hypothetical protein AYK25_00630 [Thermoplasmatales archaeon SM1-50]